MIRNQKNFFIRWILHYYTRWIVSRHFHEILFNAIEVDQSKSVLLIANHFSYWDSLILYVINQKVLKKTFHVMVREDTTAASTIQSEHMEERSLTKYEKIKGYVGIA